MEPVPENIKENTEKTNIGTDFWYTLYILFTHFAQRFVIINLRYVKVRTIISSITDSAHNVTQKG
jgi:hypothetical protein